MEEEKKIPAFTEAEEMQIYEDFLEKHGEAAVIANLASAVTVMKKAIRSYAFAQMIGEKEPNYDALLTTVGVMHVACNAAEVAFGDSTEHECWALHTIKHAMEIVDGK